MQEVKVIDPLNVNLSKKPTSKQFKSKISFTLFRSLLNFLQLVKAETHKARDMFRHRMQSERIVCASYKVFDNGNKFFSIVNYFSLNFHLKIGQISCRRL